MKKASAHYGEYYLQLRELDIAGQESYSLYDLHDWVGLLQMLNENYRVQIGFHKEIWMTRYGRGPDEQVLIWTSGEES